MEKPVSKFELPKDRLATADEKGRRLYLYPAEVSGFWKKNRSVVMAVLMVFFLIVPWLRLNGQQAVLFDLEQRRFSIFGILFWAHDAPMLFFVFGGFAIALAFVTAVWGRVWCGWACPQTVFVEGVFRKIEAWVEGDSLARRRLDEAPMSFNKFIRKALKWAFFVGVSLLISHSFLAYFIGTHNLSIMMRSSPSLNPGSFGVMAFISAVIAFDFGWFREQFCTIACPYGRLQSVLMDDRSLVVGYDFNRGEPRNGSSAAVAAGRTGDCVNCYRCVHVCPTGIDIRRGTQLECIACTACADACDEVMTRFNKPKGLIRYTSEIELKSGESASRQLFGGRKRPLLYLVVLVIMATGLSVLLYTRELIEVELIRAVDQPYQVIVNAQGSGEVLNHYKIELHNQSFEIQQIKIELTPEWVNQKASIVLSNFQETLKSGQNQRADLFLKIPGNLLKQGRTQVRLLIEATETKTGKKTVLSREVVIVGPLS